jgi:hypothetical protein
MQTEITPIRSIRYRGTDLGADRLEEGGYAYEYHHGTIGYDVFTYALAKEFRKAQEAVRGMYLSPACANA